MKEQTENTTHVLAIDPGCQMSAWLSYSGEIGEFRKDSNDAILEMVRQRGPRFQHDHLAIEMIASYGMPVGKEVFETVLWIGRFIEAWNGPYTLIYRKDVKLHLCGSVRAKDANVRHALLDRFGPQGTKASPGATYGISRDVWSALAVAVTHGDLNGN